MNVAEDRGLFDGTELREMESAIVATFNRADGPFKRELRIAVNRRETVRGNERIRIDVSIAIGVFRSTDGGRSWRPSQGNSGVSIRPSEILAVRVALNKALAKAERLGWIDAQGRAVQHNPPHKQEGCE